MRFFVTLGLFAVFGLASAQSTTTPVPSSTSTSTAVVTSTLTQSSSATATVTDTTTETEVVGNAGHEASYINGLVAAIALLGVAGAI